MSEVVSQSAELFVLFAASRARARMNLTLDLLRCDVLRDRLFLHGRC